MGIKTYQRFYDYIVKFLHLLHHTPITRQIKFMSSYPILRIHHVPADAKNLLTNISKNNGITRGELLKYKIKALIEQFPEEIRQGKFERQKLSEITVTSLSENSIKELENIADFIGVNVSSLIKVELYTVIEETPKHLKRDFRDY